MNDHIDWESYDKFMKAMLEILEEKQKDYKDTWKTANLDFLQDLLIEQTITLVPTNSKRSKRKLIHIANYCYFLYTRIEQGDFS